MVGTAFDAGTGSGVDPRLGGFVYKRWGFSVSRFSSCPLIDLFFHQSSALTGSFFDIELAGNIDFSARVPARGASTSPQLVSLNFPVLAIPGTRDFPSWIPTPAGVVQNAEMPNPDRIKVKQIGASRCGNLVTALSRVGLTA